MRRSVKNLKKPCRLRNAGVFFWLNLNVFLYIRLDKINASCYYCVSKTTMFDCTVKYQNLIQKMILHAVFVSILVISINPHLAAAADISIPLFETKEITEDTKQTILIKETISITATAYSSTPDNTDSTPFITSNGKPVYDGLIAANWLPYNTKIRIPDIFGEKIFTVNDRMNARYKTGRFDVWMKSRDDARKFGARRVRVQIVETL